MDRATQHNLRRLGTDLQEARDRIDDVISRPITGYARVEAVLIKITGVHDDSPASGPLMLVGDLYGNGYWSDLGGLPAAPTTTGVACYIPDLDAGVTEPSYGTWAALPPCAGIKTRQTWQGETEEHENDTVYALAGLLLLV